MHDDLLLLTAELVDVPSESRREAVLVDLLEAEMRALGHLEVTRVGDNLVARTAGGRSTRLVLAGHTDTVPANGNATAVLDGTRVSGLGACDMKGGLAVMVDLARRVDDPAVELTFVFYAREEIAAFESGLGELVERRPDLLQGDVAILGEPTSGALEAGCQGTMRVRIALRGTRAHTARPWMGRNAVHRLAPLLAAIDVVETRQPVVGGCVFREALQVVAVEGGVAGNVVPDHAEILLNHRFAPDRTGDEAAAYVRSVVDPFLDADDVFEIVDVADGAAPGLDHPLFATLIAENALEVRAKLGWTDVARFAALGIPAANFGPGDPTIAHTAGEFVERNEIELVHAALLALVSTSLG